MCLNNRIKHINIVNEISSGSCHYIVDLKLWKILMTNQSGETRGTTMYCLLTKQLRRQNGGWMLGNIRRANSSKPKLSSNFSRKLGSNMTLVDPNIFSSTKQQIGDRMLENIGRRVKLTWNFCKRSGLSMTHRVRLTIILRLSDLPDLGSNEFQASYV